nr:hypothetical protein [Segetibacter sp.]
MNTKTTLILKPLSFLLTVFFSSTLFSQTVVTVTDCNLNGWEKQPLPGTTVEFAAVPPKPLLGNGSLRYHHPTGSNIIRVRSQHYHDTLLSSLTELRYSTFIESRENNTDNVLFVMLVDKTGDGRADDYLIFEPRWQTGKWVEGKVPDQGPTVLRKWQTWDLLKGIWWFGPAPPRPNPEFGGEFVSFEDFVRQNPGARILNNAPAGAAGGLRL